MKKICFLVFLITVYYSHNAQNKAASKLEKEKITIKKDARNLFTLDFRTDMYPALISFSNAVFEVLPDTVSYSESKSEFPWSSVKVENSKRKDEYRFTFNGYPKGMNENYSILAKLTKGNSNEKVAAFRLRRMPDPTVDINGVVCQGLGTITTGDLLKAGKISCKIPGKDYTYMQKHVQFPIMSFVFSAQTKGVVKEIENEGENFSLEVIETLKTLQVGDIVFLENIKVKAPDGTIRKIATCSMTIQ